MSCDFFYAVLFSIIIFYSTSLVANSQENSRNKKSTFLDEVTATKCNIDQCEIEIKKRIGNQTDKYFNDIENCQKKRDSFRRKWRDTNEELEALRNNCKPIEGVQVKRESKPPSQQNIISNERYSFLSQKLKWQLIDLTKELNRQGKCNSVAQPQIEQGLKPIINAYFADKESINAAKKLVNSHKLFNLFGGDFRAKLDGGKAGGCWIELSLGFGLQLSPEKKAQRIFYRDMKRRKGLEKLLPNKVICHDVQVDLGGKLDSHLEKSLKVNTVASTTFWVYHQGELGLCQSIDGLWRFIPEARVKRRSASGYILSKP